MSAVLESARERDTAAIIKAAVELFAARGPAATSLREVATRAGVNYGLIHQYIGNKDDLIRLAARRSSESMAAQLATTRSAPEALEVLLTASSTSQSPFLRMLARLILDGHDPADLLGRSPALSEMIHRLRDDDASEGEGAEAAVRVAAMISMIMGWRLFGGFVQAAVGLEHLSRDELGRRVLAYSSSIYDSGALRFTPPPAAE